MLCTVIISENLGCGKICFQYLFDLYFVLLQTLLKNNVDNCCFAILF